MHEKIDVRLSDKQILSLNYLAINRNIFFDTPKKIKAAPGLNLFDFFGERFWVENDIVVALENKMCVGAFFGKVPE